MNEESWICAAKPLKPISRPFSVVAKPLKFTARPADDIEIDPLQGRTQLRAIEVAVVVDPASNVRVVHVGQVLQGLVTALMKRPPPDFPADGREGLRADGWHEALRRETLPHRFPRSETEAEKVKRLVREVATPVRILAVDDPRLLGMQHQLAGRKAVGKRAP